MDLCIAVLTFPFIKKNYKLKILKKIYTKLNYGGAIIIVDKIYSDHSIFEDIFSQSYNDFKSKNFTQSEILNKAKLLRGSLFPSSNNELIKLLKKSGFKRFEVFFRWFNFSGYIAVK